MLNTALLLTILSLSFVTGLVIFFLSETQVRLRSVLNITAASVKVVLVLIMMAGVAAGMTFEAELPLLPDYPLRFRADPLALLFIVLSVGLWLIVTVYAIAYLEGSPNRSRFFGFFSLCVTATTGIALAADLVTFFVFYELLTLSTYPLVAHRGTPESLRAARQYLVYTLSGGIVLLLGIVWLQVLTGDVDFAHTPALALLAATDPGRATALFWLLVAGFAVKAALFPLHAWLPKAMVAPAPVSALLHAVAVVKAGAFGITRLVMDVFGTGVVADLGVGVPLALLAGFTIVFGSVMALRQQGLKARLAYSTVSQLSYITLGIALASPLAIIGGLVHLVHQGVMKITLFLCAGAFSECLNITKVTQMDGIGRRMPWTMGAFTIGALGMIGLPPMAGFISKWYLALGGLEHGSAWVLVVLLASTLLNAAYFLPVLYRAWFVTPAADAAALQPYTRPPGLWLILPAVITAIISLGVGAFAAMPLSPLSWAQMVEGFY